MTNGANVTNEVFFKVEGLSKSMGKREILHNISFEAYSGEVFGFLGPNGAGKTTTIKLAAGLLGIEKGSIEIAGFDVTREHEKAMSELGAIVENPEMYRYLSGRKNLELAARVRGVSKERISEVTELVGLSNRINDKVSKYSLGMRQRLGVAQSLLHRPKVMILDEPTNGLDPAGIKELRDILKKMAHEEGICVIVSSHLMSEMELMCDRVGIIANGKMLSVHTLKELTDAAAGGRMKYRFKVSNAAAAVNILTEADFINDKEFELWFDADIAEDAASAAAQKLFANKIMVYSMTQTDRNKLEDVFIELTQNKEGDGQIG